MITGIKLKLVAFDAKNIKAKHNNIMLCPSNGWLED